jgi:hypothetical protein
MYRLPALRSISQSSRRSIMHLQAGMMGSGVVDPSGVMAGTDTTTRAANPPSGINWNPTPAGNKNYMRDSSD